MKLIKELPVFSISNFEDYNQCQHCGNSFYIRVFDEHLEENRFIDKPHSHDFFIILMITRGSGIHNIDFKSYAVFPGAVFFVTPGQIHNWVLSDDINGYILFFKKEYLLIDYDQSKLLRLPFFYTNINAPFLKLEADEIECVAETFKRVDKEYKERKAMFHDIMRLNLRILLVEFERRYSENKAANLMRYYENQIHKLETLIDEHYKEHVPVAYYADRMNVSIKQLNTLCKRALNRTLGDLIQERVILEAKRLLVHSDHSISTIARLLNYADNSYFIRLFRKVTGLPPEQFRIKRMIELVT